MKDSLLWLTSCLTITILVGCAQAPKQPKETAPSSPIPATPKETVKVYEHPYEAAPSSPIPATTCDNSLDDELLGYAKRFGDLSADGQKKEYTLIMQSLSRNKNDTSSRLKAALIAALPSSRYRDNVRAISLLDEIQRDKRMDNETRSLTAILKDYVIERQKSDDNAAKLAQKAKDEQQRADDLQQKLDDLRNIEKALIERNQPPRK
jgi:hypothetical protein